MCSQLCIPSRDPWKLLGALSCLIFLSEKIWLFFSVLVSFFPLFSPPSLSLSNPSSSLETPDSLLCLWVTGSILPTRSQVGWMLVSSLWAYYSSTLSKNGPILASLKGLQGLWDSGWTEYKPQLCHLNGPWLTASCLTSFSLVSSTEKWKRRHLPSRIFRRMSEKKCKRNCFSNHEPLF